MTNKEIISFLTSTTTNAGFVDKLKIRYRPLICPFNDLIHYADQVNSVFDIGCGSGQFCALLAEYTKAQKIMGIEINDTLVRNAREVNTKLKQSKEIKFERFDGKNIPEEINSYDLVYMIDVFHHIPPDQQIAFIRQLYSKMKPGAKLIFKDMDKGTPLVLFNKLHDMIFAGEIGNEITAVKAKSLLSEAGFKIKDSYKKTILVYAHYFIVCEK